MWFDADASGTPEVPGDVADGIAGVSVSLIADSKGNGVWDAGEPVIATDVTDADGRYLFEGLPLNDGDGDADYIVWVNDTDNVLGDLIQTYDADGIGTPDVSAVALSGGAPVNLDQDFSYTAPGHEPGKGLIGDTVFLDAVNNDGGYNPGEGDQPIEGVTVILKDAGGNVIATTETNENGNYYFGGLDPDATYTVEVDPSTLPSGLKPTYDDDGIGTPNSSTVTLTPANLVNLDQDFGYDPSGPLGLIGNEVWLDTNADGFLDGPAGPDGIPGNDDDEPMIEGVTLDLYWDKNANGVIDPGEPKMGTEVTNADGIYRFENLPVDDGGGDRAYIVDVTDEDGVLNGYWHSLGELNGDIVTSPIAPPSATITNFVNDVDKRTIKAGDNEKLTVEFVEQLKNAVDANYSIVVNFTLGCSITFAPGGTPTPVCEATGESTLNISDDKIEWKVLNSGLDDITVESIEIAWPSGHGDIEKINLVGDIVDRNISPPAATITSFDGDIDDRTIEAGKEETLSVEFEDKLEGMNNDDYSITLNFVEGCSVTFDPAATPGGNFACDKPLDLLTMIWDGSTPSVRIKAWKDTPGDQLLADIDNINVGEAVTVDGYAPKDGNDVIWEVFVAGTNTKLGESVYHMSCSDDDMNDAADCGKRQGNGKSNDGGYINDWLLEEMVDANGMLNCTPGIGAAMLQGSAPTTMFEAVFLPFVSNR